MEVQEQREPVDLLEQQVQRVQQEILVKLDLRVIQGFQEILEQLDHQVFESHFITFSSDPFCFLSSFVIIRRAFKNLLQKLLAVCRQEKKNQNMLK